MNKFEFKDYDIDTESYENYFSMEAINVDDIEDIHFFEVYGDRNDLPLLIEFANDKQKRFTGHNSYNYDTPILLSIVLGYVDDAQSINRLSRQIIDTEQEDKKDMIPHYYELFYPKEDTIPWGQDRDTMAMTRVNRNVVSLKNAAVHLHHNRLQDLPIDPYDSISPEQVPLLREYLHNDVMVQRKLSRILKPLFDLRAFLSEHYDTNVYSVNDTAVANKVLAHLLPEITGIPFEDIKDRRTPRDTIWLGECISSDIHFETPELNALLDYMKTITLYKDSIDAPYEVQDDENVQWFGSKTGGKNVQTLKNFKMPKYVDNASDTLKKILVQDPKNGRYLLKVKFDGVIFKLGIGGLHSESPSEILESDDLYQLIEIDGSSYYPAMIIANDFYPAHLPELKEVLIQMIALRLAEKKKGGDGDANAAKLAQILKISVNSVFGNLNNQYSWLFDPMSMVCTTVSGQLCLLDIAEKLYLAGHHTVGGNTDGLNIRVLRSRLPEIEEFNKELKSRFRIGFETTKYNRIVTKDVNNYLAEIDTGKGTKIKLKGVFGTTFANDKWSDYLEFYDMVLYNDHINGRIPEQKLLDKYRTIPNFAKGFSHPIVPIGLYMFYIHNIPPEVTIRKDDSIYNFMVSKKADTKKFQPVLININSDGEREEIELQKTNRVICTTHGGSLVKKHKLGGRDSKILAGQAVMLLNDVVSEDPNDYPLDYQFYIDEVYKVIDQISPLDDFLF